MARDPRKNSAFDSGMRGREKPKVQESHGSTAVNDNAGGESKQGAGKTIGTPGGVDLSAYSSGMRGIENPSRSRRRRRDLRPAVRRRPGGGENKQGPNTHVGNPDGDNTAGRGARKGVHDPHLQKTAHTARNTMGIPGNNTEAAAQQSEPEGQAGILGDEDDTHINLRIPKASLKKKNPGLQTS
jgi:hypothetical protein